MLLSYVNLLSDFVRITPLKTRAYEVPASRPCVRAENSFSSLILCKKQTNNKNRSMNR